jgi:hypothetical protein
VEALQLLKRSGHRFDPQELQVCAMWNGWDGRGAREPSEYAAGILAARTVLPRGVLRHWITGEKMLGLDRRRAVRPPERTLGFRSFAFLDHQQM